MELKNQIVEWVSELPYSNYKDEECISEGKDGAVLLSLFTDTNRYSIRATQNYLGCVVQSRKPRAGEDWVRGHDMHDGNFCRETWDEIIKGIVGNELVKIHRKKPDNIMEEI